MAEAIRECGRQIQDAKSRLDSIDQCAHDEIDQILKSKGGWFGPLAVLAAIFAIISRARSDAIAVVTDAVRAIAQQAAKVLSADAPTSSGSPQSSGEALEAMPLTLASLQFSAV
jgi:hypothetical protein